VLEKSYCRFAEAVGGTGNEKWRPFIVIVARPRLTRSCMSTAPSAGTPSVRIVKS
jgi:hypothetical protein